MGAMTRRSFLFSMLASLGGALPLIQSFRRSRATVGIDRGSGSDFCKVWIRRSLEAGYDQGGIDCVRDDRIFTDVHELQAQLQSYESNLKNAGYF
jgi:hypothetical protein